MSKRQTRLIWSVLTALVISATLSASAHAQYVWLDEKGSKQFSDMPPPANTPKNRILKAPNKVAEEKLPASAAEAGTEAPNAASKPQKPVTTTSKNEDFMKRRTEQAEAEKKAAAEAQSKADQSKNCERAKAYQQSLESGVRIATTDKNGERSYFNDAQRSQELADVKKATAACK